MILIVSLSSNLLKMSFFFLTPDSEKHKLIDKAKRLGLEIYRRDYNSFKIKCGVGINLKDKVIKPLLDAAYGDEFEKENK